MELLDLQARLALQAHRPKVAAKAYRRILQLKPKDPHAAESLAFTLVAADQKRDAAKAFENLLKINPSNIKGRTKLINIMFELGYPAKQISGQKKYLEYYKWVREQASKKAAKTAKKNARLGIRTNGLRYRGSQQGK